jgi:hypothetical protein
MEFVMLSCDCRNAQPLYVAIVGIGLFCSLACTEFPKFEYHQIARIGNKMGQTSLVDVDKDGDIDICSKPWNGDEHVYLRNMLKE